MGKGLFAGLRRLDKQITGIARYRQRAGDKLRTSARYRRLVSASRPSALAVLRFRTISTRW
jgi:hypothetical protein